MSIGPLPAPLFASSLPPRSGGESEFLELWVGMMRDAETSPRAMFAPGMKNTPSHKKVASCRAPFSSSGYEVGIFTFPSLVAVQPDAPGIAAGRDASARLASFGERFPMRWAQRDPVVRDIDTRMHAHIPAPEGRVDHRFTETKHFFRKDVPAEIVERVVAFAKGMA